MKRLNGIDCVEMCMLIRAFEKSFRSILCIFNDLFVFLDLIYGKIRFGLICQNLMITLNKEQIII